MNIKISVTDARLTLSDLLLDDVRRDGKHVIITYRDSPAAVLVPVSWYQQAIRSPGPLTAENPVLPFAGEVRFTASTDLLFRLLDEVYRRGGDRHEGLNAILAEAVSRYLGQEDGSSRSEQGQVGR